MSLKDDDKKNQKEEEQPMSTNHKPIIDLNEVRASRMDQDFGKLNPVKKYTVKVPVRNPHRHQWIRVHAEWELEVQIFEDKDTANKEVYLVGPKALEALAGEWTRKILYVYIDRRGDVFFWPITLPDENGMWNDWSQTAFEAAQLAKKSWVRVASNKNIGAYEVYTPDKQQIEDPDWSEYDFQELVDKAFKDRYINDPEHEIIKKLHGAS